MQFNLPTMASAVTKLMETATGTLQGTTVVLPALPLGYNSSNRIKAAELQTKIIIEKINAEKEIRLAEIELEKVRYEALICVYNNQNPRIR